jgi:hypothetical protein
MNQAGIPAFMLQAWAKNAASPAYVRPIPNASQISITPGAASFADGFPPLTFLPLAAGGVPPFGQDINGILQAVTQWLIWLQAGGPIYYNAAFATAVGGYPKGAVVSSDATLGVFWLNEADGNTTDPDGATPLNWAKFNVLTQTQTTGHCVWRPTTEVLDGYVRCNFLTCGDRFCNGTERANDDCLGIFQWLWGNFTDAICPMFNSSGGAVFRGANYLADWNLHYAICTPDMRGNWPGGLDTMGNTSAGRLSTANFAVGSGSIGGARGSFIQPNAPPSTQQSAAFVCGTWHVAL